MLDGGGSPRWYELYRRVLRAGKSIEAINVNPEEVEPLLDAIGPKGTYLWVWARNESEARNLIEKAEKYRDDR